MLSRPCEMPIIIVFQPECLQFRVDAIRPVRNCVVGGLGTLKRDDLNSTVREIY